MRTYFVMMGETAGWSDTDTWPVCIFQDKEQADQYVLVCNAWLKRRGVLSNEDMRPTPSRGILQEIPPFDPGYSTSALGASYSIVELPLVTEEGANELQVDMAALPGCTVLKETPMALLVHVDGVHSWLPKSQIDNKSDVYKMGTEGVLIIPQWLADQKGIT